MTFKDYFSKYKSKLGVRVPTFEIALEVAEERNFKNFTETGCIRKRDNWSGDGYSTILFADFVKSFGGHLHSCDISKESIDLAKDITKEYEQYITFIQEDSIKYLQDLNTSIDFLYLDSLDGSLPGHSQHQLDEVMAAEHLLHDKSIILLDDVESKGKLSIPYLLRKNWITLRATSAQVAFIKS